MGANFSDMPTDADSDVDHDIMPFQLGQNFPNPFNAATTIRFNISRRAPVILEVLNILGQKVGTLIDETMPAGQHEIRWNGDDSEGRPYATGIYLYRLRAEDVVQTKKMLLLK